MTVLPCFRWIFAGAPLADWIEGQPRPKAAINAAVLGVILNLAAWFALHVLFAGVAILRAGPLDTIFPVWVSFQPLAAALSVLAAWLLLGRHKSMKTTLATVAALPAGLQLLGLT